MQYERMEYPRPQFRREDWIPLNGMWEFELDDEQSGIARGLETGRIPLSRTIRVPFTYEYPASGIGDARPHETVWYRRTFSIDAARKKRRTLLCFNASDHRTAVWVNGRFAVRHTGGFSPFWQTLRIF